MRAYLAIVLLLSCSILWAGESRVAPKLLDARELPVQVEQAALQRQYDALRGMRLQMIEYSNRGPVHYLQGDTGVILPPYVTNLAIGDGGTEFLPLFKDVLLANGSEDLRVTESEARPSSVRRLVFSQSIRGIPVIHGLVGIEYDDTTKRVTDLIASFIPDRGLPREPKITAARAEQVVAEALVLAKDSRADDMEIIAQTYLAYYEVYSESSAPYLVWVVEADFNGSHERFLVDAVAGSLVDSQKTSTSLTR